MSRTHTDAMPAEPEDLTPGGYSHRQILVIIGALMLGMLLATLDQTIVSTALPTISKDLHRPDLYSWVVTSYLLVSSATMPLYGKLSDLYGRKRIFEVAITIFLLGSIFSGLSRSMLQLIMFRGLQGLGAGGLISLALAIVGDIVSPRERGRYQGYFGITLAASSVLGPLIGGFLVDTASWRWCFYVNIPIGIVALLVIDRVLKLDHRPRTVRIDWVGAVLAVTGVSLLLVGVQEFGTAARLTTDSLVFGVIGLVIIVGFVIWEHYPEEPIVPLRLFHRSTYSLSVVLSFILGTVMFGGIIFFPRYLQLVRGISPTISGLALLPMLVGMIGASTISGILVSRFGRYKVFIVSGMVILTAGSWLVTHLDTSTSGWTFSGWIFVIGVGTGLQMQNLVLASQNAVEPGDLGAATSGAMFFRTLGGAIGASVFGAILLAFERTNLPHLVLHYGAKEGATQAFTQGMAHAYVFVTIIVAVGILLSFFLKEVELRKTSSSTLNARQALLDAEEATQLAEAGE